MIDPFRSASVRAIAISALVFYAPVLIASVLREATWGRNYPGILFHLALFLMVSRLAAPDWARAAGYGWLVLDVMAGVLTLDGLPYAIYEHIRLGGHVFGGIWIATASLSGSRAVRIVGVVTGLYLSGFSFLSPFLSPRALGPAGFLLLIWLAIIAWQNGSARTATASNGLTGSSARRR